MKSVIMMLLMGAAAAAAEPAPGSQGASKETTSAPKDATSAPKATSAAEPSGADALAAKAVAAKATDEAKAPADAGRSVDGRPLVMVGHGEHLRDGEKLYDMAIWIDEQDGKRAFPALAMRAGGRNRAKLIKGEHAPNFVIWGRFTKQAVLTFARAVPAATMREELKGELGEIKGADELLALLPDAAAGDEWVLTTRDNGEIALTVGKQTKDGPQSPRLQRALWGAWLGPKPIETALRQKLIEHIDVLAR